MPEKSGRRNLGDNLGDQDSNLDKQNQNLLCYRYTIAQYSGPMFGMAVFPPNLSTTPCQAERATQRPTGGSLRRSPSVGPWSARRANTARWARYGPRHQVGRPHWANPGAERSISRDGTAPNRASASLARPALVLPSGPACSGNVRHGRLRHHKSSALAPALPTRLPAGQVLRQDLILPLPRPCGPVTPPSSPSRSHPRRWSSPSGAAPPR